MSKTGIVQISLRLNYDVYEILKNKASENGRSLNAEVIQAIVEHCDSNSIAARIERLERFADEVSANFPDTLRYRDFQPDDTSDKSISKS